MTAPRHLWLLAVAALATAAATTVFYRHLWEPDEPRYCQSASEMIESGEWLLPRLHGQPYGHKPPVFMWLVAAGRLAGLSWTPAGVFPSLVPFVVLLLLMPAMARGFGLSRSAGQLAAAFLAASPLAAIMALAARMDTLLEVFFTLSLWLTARLLWPSGPPSPAARWALWVTLAVATLTKGPVVLVLFALTIGLTCLVARPRPRVGPIFSGFGPLAGVGVLLAWLVPAGLRGGPAYLQEILVRQSVGRMVDSFAHQKPFYYHLVTYPATGLPFAVLALMVAFTTLRGRRSQPHILLASAMVAVLGFFSLLSGKLVIYLLPLFPAAALLAAEAAVTGRGPLRAGLGAGAVGMMLMGTAVGLSPFFRAELGDYLAPLAVAGGAIVACGLWALWGVRRRRNPITVASRLTLAGVILPAVVFPIATRALDPTMHLATVAAAVVQMEPDVNDGFVFRMNVSGPSLYTGRVFRKVSSVEDLGSLLLAGRAIIVEEKIWRRVDSALSHLTIRKTVFNFRTGPVFVLRAKLPAPPAAARDPVSASPAPADLADLATQALH